MSVVRSNGADATTGHNATCDDAQGGPGAGGSLWVRAKTLSVGVGVLDASGGAPKAISQPAITGPTGGIGRVRVDYATVNGQAFGSPAATSATGAATTTGVGHSAVVP